MTVISFDRAEIMRTWQIFRQPGEVLELRIPKAGKYKTISGYFDDPGMLADAVIGLENEPFTGIYFTINPVKPDLLARANNRSVRYAETTTSDSDIAALHWLPVDLDAKRPAGISATDAEHEAAIAKAREIRDWLINEQGWPAGAFVLADSSNGGHLSIKIDLESAPANVALVKGCLEALDLLFSDEKIHVDVTSQNPARIWKLYGTTTRKGDSTPERPHRMARIIEVPEESATVSREQLEVLTAMLPEQEAPPPQSYPGGQEFDPVEYCRVHNLPIHHTKTWTDPKGIKCALVVLERCVFNVDHKLSACIIGWPNGARTYRCRHHSCLAKHWKEAREVIEPNKTRLDHNAERLEELGRDDRRRRAKQELGEQGQGAEDPEAARKVLDELAERIKSNHREIKKPDVLRALADLKRSDPIEYGLFIDDLELPRTAKTEAKREIERLAETKAESEPTSPEVSPEIKAKALTIATRGDPVKYLIYQAQLNHLGDIPYQKVLLCSIASGSSSTSNGIQPGSTGEKGSGKSDACRAVYLLVPEDHRIEGSLSPMSLFAMQEAGLLQSGMILFSDDVEHEPLIPIYKRSTSAFQHGTKHYTLDKNRELRILSLPPRQVWWLTSVEAVANDQAFDRQYPISTDTTTEHKKRVSKEIAIRRARKELRMVVDEGILVAQAILSDIFEHGPFRVLIPQALKAAWTIPSDFRGQQRFWDLVDALVILRWRQHQIDPDGWLIASEEDLKEAKELFMAHKTTHATTLTPSELQLVGVLLDGQPRTQKDLVEALSLSQSTITQRLTSIMAKSPVITVDQDGARKYYQLNPNIDHKTDYWQNIELIKFGHEKPQCSTVIGELLHCYRYVIGIPIGVYINNSRRIPDSYCINSETRSNELFCAGCEECLGSKLNSSLWEPPTTPIIDQNQQAEVQKPPNNSPNNTPNQDQYQQQEKPNNLEADLLHAKKWAKERDERFSTPGKQGDGQQLEEPEKVCLACGEDIGPGRGNYYGKLCSSCGPKWYMVKVAAKAQTEGFTTSELWEDLALKGSRPPLKEYLAAMLRALDYVEANGVWRRREPPGSSAKAEGEEATA